MVQRSVGNGAPQRHKAWGLSQPSEPPSTKTSGTHLGNRCWLLGSDGQMTKLTTAHARNFLHRHRVGRSGGARPCLPSVLPDASPPPPEPRAAQREDSGIRAPRPWPKVSVPHQVGSPHLSLSGRVSAPPSILSALEWGGPRVLQHLL